jgi:chromosome segregation ATPase
MDDWAMHVFAATAGPGVLALGIARIAPWLAKWGAHRAGAEEAREQQVRSLLDEMRGARERLTEEADKLRIENAELRGYIDDLKKIIGVLQLEIEEYRAIIRTGHGSVPPIRTSVAPHAHDESVTRNEKDRR